MTIPDEKKLEVVHQHYRDTFDHIQACLRVRDRLFLCIIALLAISAFQLFSPGEAPGMMAEWIKEKLSLAMAPNVDFLGSVLWFLILGIALRYFQAVVHLERAYAYIHRIESELSPHWDDRIFTREGVNYNSNYPLFSCLMDWMYKLVFPLVFLLVLSVRIYSDCQTSATLTGTLAFNIAAFGTTVLGTILYLIKLHHKTSEVEQDVDPNA